MLLEMNSAHEKQEISGNPKINKRSKEMAKAGEPVYDRLYGRGMEL